MKNKTTTNRMDGLVVHEREIYGMGDTKWIVQNEFVHKTPQISDYKFSHVFYNY